MQHTDPKIIKLLCDRADLTSPASDAYKALTDAANVLAAGNFANPDLPAIHTIDDYQRAAAVTAVYSPNTPAYPFLGIAGECGELIEVLIAPRVDYDRMVKELGDVCWYFAAVCRDVWTDNPHAMSSLCVEHPGPYETWSPSDFAIAAGKVCEAAKKCLRDSAGQWDTKHRDKLHGGLLALGYAITGCCNRMEVDLMDVLRVNIDKLYSRKARGTLQGSGDNR